LQEEISALIVALDYPSISQELQKKGENIPEGRTGGFSIGTLTTSACNRQFAERSAPHLPGEYLKQAL